MLSLDKILFYILRSKLNVISETRLVVMTVAQTSRTGTARRKGARGPSWRFSDRRLDTSPALMASSPLY